MITKGFGNSSRMQEIFSSRNIARQPPREPAPFFIKIYEEIIAKTLYIQRQKSIFMTLKQKLIWKSQVAPLVFPGKKMLADSNEITGAASLHSLLSTFDCLYLQNQKLSN